MLTPRDPALPRERPRLARSVLRAALIAGALLAAGCTAELRGPDHPGFEPLPCEAIPPRAYKAQASAISAQPESARRHYARRLKEFEQDPLGCGEIVMLGDSLTELTDWSLIAPPGIRVQNRGIGGDTTDGVLARLDEIIARKPRAVFLLIGTNDLWLNRSADTIADGTLEVASKIRRESPQTRVFVQTVFPLRGEPATWGGDPNQTVRAVNAKLAAAKGDPGIILLDTYKLLADDAGLLNTRYTGDGLHVNRAGYDAWQKLVDDEIRQHSLGAATPD